MAFDFDKAVDTLADNKILTKVLLILLLDVSSTYANLPTYTYNAIKQTAQLGLLTRLENAGFTLSTAAPLLKLVDEQDLIGYLEASSDKVLPLVAKGRLAPPPSSIMYMKDHRTYISHRH